MASSAVDVCNLALTNLGVGTEIAELDERTAEAKACNRVYENARDEVLRSFNWPFAKKHVALALVTTKGDASHPTSEFKFSYRYPSDCLMARKILSEVRNDSRSSRWTFDEMCDDQGTLIVSDKPLAVLEFTSTLGQNPGRWTADFVTALSHLVAAKVGPRLTKGDPFKTGTAQFELYKRAIAIARANSANEVQPDEDPESDSILIRR